MFIAFEGLDGSGSTTQSKLLTEKLSKAGHSVLTTKEPTSSNPIGKTIREVLQHQWKAPAEGLQLLFSADRAQHLNDEIKPALNQGKIVITDRYILSTLAFGALEVDMEWLATLNKPFIQPDLTFLLRLDPKICLERIEKRGGAVELFEQQEKLEKVWENYEAGTKYFKNIHLIEANQSIEAIAEEVFEITSKHLN